MLSRCRWFRGPLHTILVGLIVVAPLGAQVPELRLERPDTFAEAFSLLNGARELSDGRLVVSDWIEERVAILSFETGAVESVGTVGAGPSEFRLPDGLLPFRGDSTILRDLGNQRLAVVGPDGRIHRTIRVTVPGAGSPRAVDADGRFYFVQPGWATGAPPSSTAPRPLARWLPDGGAPVEIERVDTARPRSDAGRPRHTPGIPLVVFAARDGWAASLDGTVAIVRWDPYRVEWLSPQGRSHSAVIPHEPAPVTDDDCMVFVRRFLERTPVSGRGPDGGLGQTEPASEAEVRSMVETNEFATHHAPFDPGAIFMSPAGRLWVGRTPAPRSPQRFDIFAPRGDRIAQVTLPVGRSLLAIGHRYAYAVTRDALDLETLERYEIPPLPSP